MDVPLTSYLNPASLGVEQVHINDFIKRTRCVSFAVRY